MNVKTGGSVKGEKDWGAVCLSGGTLPHLSSLRSSEVEKRPQWFLRLCEGRQSGRDMDHWRSHRGLQLSFLVIDWGHTERPSESHTHKGPACSQGHQQQM